MGHQFALGNVHTSRGLSMPFRHTTHFCYSITQVEAETKGNTIAEKLTKNHDYWQQ